MMKTILYVFFGVFAFFSLSYGNEYNSKLAEQLFLSLDKKTEVIFEMSENEIDLLSSRYKSEIDEQRENGFTTQTAFSPNKNILLQLIKLESKEGENMTCEKRTYWVGYELHIHGINHGTISSTYSCESI